MVNAAREDSVVLTARNDDSPPSAAIATFPCCTLYDVHVYSTSRREGKFPCGKTKEFTRLTLTSRRFCPILVAFEIPMDSRSVGGVELAEVASTERVLNFIPILKRLAAVAMKHHFAAAKKLSVGDE